MKEVKTPRKPLAIYYAIVLLTLLLLNLAAAVDGVAPDQRGGLRHLYDHDRGEEHRPCGH